MKLRLALTSVVLAFLSAGVAWMTIQPLMGLLFETTRALGGDPALLKWQSAVPLLLGLDLVLASGLVFMVLYFTFGRPLERAEETIEQISSENVEVVLSGGPLLARLDKALRRLSAALVEERASKKKRVDELKATNEALVRLQAELVGADRLATVGKLAAGVAHEVGNPLAGILGYLSVVRMSGKDQPELLDLVHRIEHEVQRIDQIVRALLELGRPSRGTAGPLAVRPVIDSCVQLLAAGREFKNVKISVDCDLSLYLCAEGGPLSQVLVNLLLNAAQAMGEQGEISLTAGTGGARGFIAVADRGPGIPAHVAARLFEPFFTTRAVGQGTGLGLAVSRHLLAQFEGTLEAANREGGGAVFTISLPTP